MEKLKEEEKLRYQQLIFDCDGVLVDTEIVAAEVMTEMFRKYGVDIEVDEYIHQYTGKIITTVFESLLPEEELKNLDLNELSNQCDEDIYKQLRAIRGMKEMILQLPLQKSVVSNSRLWQVKKAIKHIGLEEAFEERYFSSEMVPRPKPWPDLYLYAAETLNTPPEKCLVVEDSISGAKAAVDAGMTVIGFTGASHILPGHDQKLLELGVNKVVSTPEELFEVVDSLFEIQ